MNITIAGYGFVGKAHEMIFQQAGNINIVDPKINNNRVYDYKTDALVICVATPQSENGACEMSHVYDVLTDADKSIPILIKSTISLEGWQYIRENFPEHNLTFSPEFLREANYLNDIRNLDNILIGGDGVDFWQTIFKNVFTNLSFTVASVEELILIKYFRNSFLATKVAFFNQIYDLCDKLNLNYDAVANGIGIDSRITSSHTQVTEQRGFGGHCFPKDTSAILHTANGVDYDLTILREAVEYNKNIRKK